MFHSWAMKELSLLVTACLQALCGVHWPSQSAARRPALPHGPFSPAPPPAPTPTPTSHCSSFLWRSRAWRDFNRTHIHINNTAWRKRKLKKRRKTHFNSYPFLTPLNSAQCEWRPYAQALQTFHLRPSTCLTYHSPCREWVLRELFQGWWWETIRASEKIFWCINSMIVTELWTRQVILISIFP